MTTVEAPAESAAEDDGELSSTKVDLSLLDSWKESLLPCPPTELQKLTSREAFQSRLRTFLPLTYFCKPTSLSPLVCARFGWINTSVDMIKCSSCKAALVVKIHPKIKQQSTIVKLVKAYQSKLATAHKSACPFRFEAQIHLLSDPTTEMLTVPSHFASILPQDIWEMLEQPNPLSVLRARWHAIMEFLFAADDCNPRDGQPPKFVLPNIELPQEVLHFGIQDEHDDIDSEKNARKRRMLAKLAFDPHKPFSAIGIEAETLLSTLDDILLPHSEQDEVRPQTRTMDAWEDIHEGTAALALLGWEPSCKEGSEVVSLHCSICLSTLKFRLKKYEGPSSPSRVAPKETDEDKGEERPTKRRRTNHINHDASFNPLMAHRCHCPFVCGFPRDGARKTTPIWQLVAEKLLANYKQAKKNKDADETADISDSTKADEDGDAATDRIMLLLQSGVSSRVGKSKDIPSLGLYN